MSRGVVCVTIGLVAACRAAPIFPGERYPAGTDLETRQVVVDGTPIRFVETGEGPAVVLLHGVGASIYAWRHTIQPLAQAGFRVIAFDNRGFGSSGKPERGYANDDYVALLDRLLDSLGVGRAALVGHSMGGQIAAEYALAHAQRVLGLALLAPSGRGIRLPVLLAAARWPVVGPVAAALRGRWVTGSILRTIYANPAAVTEEDVDQYYAPVAEVDYGRSLRGVLRAFRFDALPERLDAWPGPTLIIWGGEDRLISPTVGRELATQFARVAFVQLPDVGHAVAEEAPERVNDLLIGFLTEGLPHIPDDLARAAEARSMSVPGHSSASLPGLINQTVDLMAHAPQAGE